ncbi:DUF4167 domain-containing protein [Maritalea sp. P4.10X]|uniref:DUF4167 domain-containing protein n=1 Tax=Maritalea mediterranea TaxID=2909667 RepID=A0ABS9E9S2_9HYPH|nr:DUF4167 domain-containing protein [Maritalea mediterranea]MCF4099508.1 DUF4167 domain-containing protein [Maritalea mediterranea]
MRPGQQNKRSRGRGNGRKNVNPLSRNYESNGPDVKVRGNASHVAEKYVQLARDAQASGDSVMAENYLQHAEHYFRIIFAAQAQNQARQEQRRERDDQDRDSENRDTESRENEDKPVEANTEAAEKDAEVKEENTSEKPAANDETGQEKPQEKPKRAPRARRPRRKPTADGDLADAPQPKLSVGDEVTAEVPEKKAAAAE